MKLSAQRAKRLYDDPVAFATDVLGITPWDRQSEILRAIANNSRVCVKSGHKTGKSTSIAILALWYAWTRPSARVILTSASARQIKNILWREVTRLYRSAKFDLGGQMFDDPNTGYRLEDGSEILGFSTDQPERMAGISGAHLLFIADEASGIPETIFEAIEGNRAGGARIAMFSNPTETSGTFFDAFNSKKNFWYPIHVSSEETPNVTGKGPAIPGLATREWVEEKRLEHGPDYLNSLWYQVRVLGEFPSQSDYAIIPLALAREATKRNPTRIGTELKAGLDPARFGDDESALAVVRGDQCLPLQTWRLLDGPQLASKVVAALQSIRRVDEAVTLKVDVIGIGASVFDALRHNKPPWLDVVGVNVANAANNPTYHLVRDEVWFSVRDWLRDGGCLPNDDQLLTELVAPIYSLPGGKIKVEPKADTKKRIGRSPDRADSLGLALYQGKTSVKEWVKQAKKLRQVLNMPRKKTL